MSDAYTERPAELDLDAIKTRHAVYAQRHDYPNAFACCSAHASADDVPALVAEVRRLREQIAVRDARLGVLRAAARKPSEDLARTVAEIEAERAGERP